MHAGLNIHYVLNIHEGIKYSISIKSYFSHSMVTVVHTHTHTHTHLPPTLKT